MMACPCRSGCFYSECCRPFHRGAVASTAVQLMRSRYAAYALCLPEYIIRTTHSENPQFEKNVAKWKRKILDFSSSTQFNDLEIIDSQEQGSLATVTFIAHLTQGANDVSFTEKSYFEKVEGRWLYRSGQLSAR